MKYSNQEITDIASSLQEDIKTLDAPELHQKYLSKKGVVKDLLSKVGQLDKDRRASYGQEVNMLKNLVADQIGLLNNTSKAKPSNRDTKIDPTAPYDINVDPAKRPQLISKKGSQHPLTQEMEYILDIFYRMGFNVEECRQLDNDYNMFEALNIPKGHPARDIWDTFWTESNLIPPAHTSTMQNRILRKYEPPIRVVIPGRCYRNEALDANHEHTLHQIEGVYVDKDISLGDMLGTIRTYLEAFFGQSLEIKVQPAFFPFTEPDMEFMISCPLCNATGCSTCGHSGWMEAMGCGMIHPEVLKEGGIDPEKFTGFAWGFGLDRLVLLKHKIEDIRWLHGGDLKFLKQF